MTDAPDPTPLVTAREGVEAALDVLDGFRELITNGVDTRTIHRNGLVHAASKAIQALLPRCAPAAEPGAGEVPGWVEEAAARIAEAADLGFAGPVSEHELLQAHAYGVHDGLAAAVQARAAAAGPGDVEALLEQIDSEAAEIAPSEAMKQPGLFLDTAERVIRTYFATHFPAAAGGGPTGGELRALIDAAAQPFCRALDRVKYQGPEYWLIRGLSNEVRAALSAARKEPAR